MRDINYRFEALKYRATILGATTFDSKDENKYDLARLLIDKYEKGQSDYPRLPSILEMIKISLKHWQNGNEEAKAFDAKEYVKLHQSTLAKVDVFENILKRTTYKSLKTKAKLKDIYGISPHGLLEHAKGNWIYNFILIITSALIGAYYGKII